MENGETNEIPQRLDIGFFRERKKLLALRSDIEKAMSAFFEHADYLESVGFWVDADAEPAEKASSKGLVEMQNDLRTNLPKVRKAWSGFGGRWKSDGLRDHLTWAVNFGACPNCGGFTDGDGDSETDGCAQDWATWSTSWSWCIGFGNDTEFTGDCCSLKARQDAFRREQRERSFIYDYALWLNYGGFATATPVVRNDYAHYEYHFDSKRRDAVNMVKEMCGLRDTAPVGFSDWLPRSYIERPFNWDQHDEGCEHKSGCGWSTTERTLTASGGSW